MKFAVRIAEAWRAAAAYERGAAVAHRTEYRHSSAKDCAERAAGHEQQAELVYALVRRETEAKAAADVVNLIASNPNTPPDPDFRITG